MLFTWQSSDPDVDGEAPELRRVSVRFRAMAASLGAGRHDYRQHGGAETQHIPQVTQLSDGRVLFTWKSYDPDVDGDSSEFRAHRYGAGDGSIAWDSTGEFTVNAEVQSTQAFPQVTQLSDGQVLFTWTSADPDVDGDNYGIAAGCSISEALVFRKTPQSISISPRASTIPMDQRRLP